MTEQSAFTCEQRGCTIILDSSENTSGKAWQDTALPFSGSVFKPPKKVLPERLRQMKHLFEYGRESQEAKAKNFYRQGKYMQDYEDDFPWEGLLQRRQFCAVGADAHGKDDCIGRDL